MKEIPIKQFPRQSLSVVLEGALYELSLKECNGIMAVTVVRDGVTIVSNRRAVAGVPIIPAGYLENGNFVILTNNSDLPYYTGFEGSNTLIYLTMEEIDEIRNNFDFSAPAGSVPSGPLVDFNYLSGKLAYGMDLSRASEATTIRDGLIKTVSNNIARFENQGLLIESSATNTLTQSATFQTWFVQVATKSSTGPAVIDSTPSTILTSTGGNFARLALNGVINSNGDYAISFICKKGTVPFAQARVEKRVSGTTVSSFVVYVDLATMQLRTLNTGADIVPGEWNLFDFGNGIIRIIGRFTLANGGPLDCYVGVCGTMGSSVSVAGDSINVIHAQIESLHGTSPIITTTAAGSRSDDVLTLTQSGAKWLYREYIPLGSSAVTKELVRYGGEICQPGHLQILRAWNRDLTADEIKALGVTNV